MNPSVASAFLLSLFTASAFSMDVRAEMRRAEAFGKNASSLVLRNEVRPNWSPDGSHLAYRVNSGPGEFQYFQVDLKTGVKAPAFDHGLLAAALAKAADRKTESTRLPLDLLLIAADGTLRFRAFGKAWQYNSASHEVIPSDLAPEPGELLAPEEIAGRRGRTGVSSEITVENATGGEIELFWAGGRGKAKSYGKIAAGGSSTQSTYAGHVWLMRTAAGEPLAALAAKDTPSFARVTGRIPAPPHKRNDRSPDKK